MKSLLGLIAILTISAGSAEAREVLVQELNGKLIRSVTIEKLSEEHLKSNRTGFMNSFNDCSNQARRSGRYSQVITGDLQIDAIINIGAKIFTLIKENAPIINANTHRANALPSGVDCWNQLEGWSVPRATTYRVTYKNLYGINVVDAVFQVIYSYGGRVNGVGRYLTNATVQYKKVDVKVGFIFNASVEIPQVMNLGTRKAPVAGMQLNLNWSIDSRPISLRKETNTATFFIAGDGRPTKLY